MEVHLRDWRHLFDHHCSLFHFFPFRFTVFLHWEDCTCPSGYQRIIVFAAIFVSMIFLLYFRIFSLVGPAQDVCLWITNMLFFHWQTQTCDFFTSVCFLLSVFGNLWSLKLLLAASLCQGLLLLQLGNHFYKFKSLSPSVWPTGSSCCSNCHLTAATALTLQIWERLFTSLSRGNISSLKGQMVSSP